MKNSKRNNSIKFFLLLISSVAISCVSSSKYQTSQQELSQFRRDKERLETLVAEIEKNTAQKLFDKQEQLSAANRRLDSLNMALQRQKSKFLLLQAGLKNAFPDMNDTQFETFIEDGYLHISLDSRILFNRGEHNLRPDGKRVITDIAGSLHDVSSDIMILGHTDDIPFASPNYDNWMLSIDRSHSVSEILVQTGISPERIIIAGRSKHDPFLESETQVGRLLNRRIEMILMPDMKQVESIFEAFVN